ncbi:hypothetical protein [Nocardioides plantarum]|uniref:Uncharacterized protein n=1 Tax=Nocardioides plantarum TaxID=29299 RepID=A0ABV5KCK4_9ACTN|nr:hypothetical protein [Nocardioides plantarum]
MDTDALKQAAIDAYMRSDGWNVYPDRDEIRYGQSNLFGVNGNVNKSGKGAAYYPDSTEDLDFTAQFAEVRARVDTALTDWQESRLPEPGALNDGAVKAREPITALNVGDATSFGGTLGGYLKTVSDNAPLFRGAALNAFNNSFVNQLPAVIANHGCLATVVAEAWSAEEEIWTRARSDRDTHIEKTTAALSAYAETEAPSDITFVLALSGAVIAGASAVATGGATLPFALATAGITAISATNDHVGELRLERNGANYQELMTAFEEGLADIDDGISQQEGLIKEALHNAWTVFEGHRSLFDLTPRVSDDGDGDWGDETSVFDVADASAYEIVLPGQDVVDSLCSGLNNLAHGVEQAEPKVVTGADDGNLLAPSAREVGLRYNGASFWMWNVGDNNASSLRNLTWDIKQGTAMLQAIIQDFRDRDADSQAALDNLRNQVGAGSGENPWA